ncbi:MAG: TetR/AcrR family transcriptional regulator [Alphaproteobacteria bacterium]|nr:TetR/AcrR family transcriptional regulator [Alphaproteobacteria bacterium]
MPDATTATKPKPAKPAATPAPARAPRKRGETRERILALAEAAVLEKGFAGTSIDELIAAAGITKSGFFYHFKDKGDLARALMQRYIEANDEILLGILKRAEELNDDPLHGFLVALRMLAELVADLPNGHPGCLVAAFTYQDQLFSRDIRALMERGNQGWREMYRDRLARIAERYPPRIPASVDDLADMANALMDGGIIQSKVMKDPQVLPRQIMLYRDFLRMVFQPG